VCSLLLNAFDRLHQLEPALTPDQAGLFIRIQMNLIEGYHAEPGQCVVEKAFGER
jgi:hypothetical protein